MMGGLIYFFGILFWFIISVSVWCCVFYNLLHISLSEVFYIFCRNLWSNQVKTATNESILRHVAVVVPATSSYHSALMRFQLVRKRKNWRVYRFWKITYTLYHRKVKTVRHVRQKPQLNHSFLHVRIKRKFSKQEEKSKLIFSIRVLNNFRLTISHAYLCISLWKMTYMYYVWQYVISKHPWSYIDSHLLKITIIRFSQLIVLIPTRVVLVWTLFHLIE